MITEEERQRIEAAAKERVDQMLAEHGPIPDHLLQDIAVRARHALGRHPVAGKRPA